MVKLVYNINCGWDDLSISEKNAEYDVSFLCREELWNALKIDTTGLKFMSEEELYERYKENASKLVKDYEIDKVLKAAIKVTYAETYFRDICYFNRAKPVLPRKCKVSKFRLVYLPGVDSFAKMDEKDWLDFSEEDDGPIHEA